MSTRKQIILGAHFPGVNNTTVWQDPDSGSQIEFKSFKHMAESAERGKFDFLFLAEGLRLREQRGKIHDLDVVGRPDTFAVLAALSSVTSNLGLIGTINATFNEPYEVARQFATLDHLSAGRAAWNVVTSSDAFTGANFRRGGYLDRELRYERARELVQTARELWDSWAPNAIAADKQTGRFLNEENAGAFAHTGDQFEIRGRFNVPRPPQGHPVILQAGDSAQGREFAAQTADAIFTRHGTLDEGIAFSRDVKARAVRNGRSADDLKVLPGVGFILGDTDADAEEINREVRLQQVSPQTAILLLEQVWNRDLSSYDADGPLPKVDPDVESISIIQGRARIVDGVLETAQRYRALAEAKNLSIRELIVEVTSRGLFVGSARTIADKLDEFVLAGASDGFILVPHIVPHGMDRFVDEVVPLLQERGALRAEYDSGSTLRENLGLTPATPATVWAERAGDLEAAAS
ncbi:NtaA/DmoA family FMN-dependent monooxygenase [Cumulibacter soli]|uniref:NtaA/DmoA family FMN-dependent monooxygenase n=1 Tax=Cumulibacter soli TaxID=2546344 RepID=UPI00106793C0|nr:NtaA/DmoA family FMN-dependent monooxygenase [Cumulibacter soli]